jgi:hypothetical protein
METKSTSDAGASWVSTDRRERVGLAAGVTTFVVLAVAFGAMALGVPYFWIVFPIGFGGVLPVIVALAGQQGRPSDQPNQSDRSASSVGAVTVGTPVDSDSHSDPRDDALRTLRGRYARGELDETAFERRLERLLETETVDDAVDWVRSRESTDRSGEGERRG